MIYEIAITSFVLPILKELVVPKLKSTVKKFAFANLDIKQIEKKLRYI